MVVHFLDHPDHQTLLRWAFPQGPTTFRPISSSAKQKIYFFDLSPLNRPSRVFFDLSSMSWAEINAKCPGQIVEWSE